MAVAEASLSTVIDSMSLGLIEFNGLRSSAGRMPPNSFPAGTGPSFWSGTPSIT
jgi:hypothetical protein